jgi:hypothetical protein
VSGIGEGSTAPNDRTVKTMVTSGPVTLGHFTLPRKVGLAVLNGLGSGCQQGVPRRRTFSKLIHNELLIRSSEDADYLHCFVFNSNDIERPMPYGQGQQSLVLTGFAHTKVGCSEYRSGYSELAPTRPTMYTVVCWPLT